MTKKEIEQAIKNGDKLWYYCQEEEEYYGVIELDTKYFKWSYNENCYTHYNEETWRTDPKPYKIFEDCLYKTKKDAEFVANNWKTRVERFEPPLWDYFEVYGSEDEVKFYLQGKIYTLSHNNWDITLSYDAGNEEYGNIFSAPLTKENYLKAVEYARKLFEGQNIEN